MVLAVGRNPTRFGGRRPCDIRDRLLSVTQEQDSTSSLESAIRHYSLFERHMTCHANTHEFSKHRQSHLSVCPQSTFETGHTCLQQQLTEGTQKGSASPSKTF